MIKKESIKKSKKTSYLFYTTFLSSIFSFFIPSTTILLFSLLLIISIVFRSILLIFFSNLTFEFLFTLQWPLVHIKEAIVGVGDGVPSNSSPGSFVHHALWKKGVGR